MTRSCSSEGKIDVAMYGTDEAGRNHYQRIIRPTEIIREAKRSLAYVFHGEKLCLH